MNTNRVWRAWGTAVLGCMGILGGSAAQSREVVPEKELIITDPKVVDSSMAKYPGPFSFWHLVTQMAGSENSGQFVVDWLKQWEEDQEINGYTVPARPAIREKVIEPWQRKDGYRPESGEPWKPRFKNAPFRLLAIVNRLDLASSFRFGVMPNRTELVAMRNVNGRYGGVSGHMNITGRSNDGLISIGERVPVPTSQQRQLTRGEMALRSRSASRGAGAGEIRFVFGVIDEHGEPLRPDLTVIFEYGLPVEVLKGRSLNSYAARWHALGDFEEFNLYGSNSPPLAALSMKQHFDDTPLLRSRRRARGERACPGEASFQTI